MPEDIRRAVHAVLVKHQPVDQLAGFIGTGVQRCCCGEWAGMASLFDDHRACEVVKLLNP